MVVINEPTIPVLVDSVKDLGGRSVIRTHFFWVEIDDEVVTKSQRSRSLMDTTFKVGGRAIVSAPSLEEPTFTSPEAIDQLFAEVERGGGRRVTTGTAWLPVLGPMDGECDGKPGSVFRIPLRLFHSAFTVRDNEIDLVGPYDSWGSTLEGTATQDYYCKEESRVFQGWMTVSRRLSEMLEGADFKQSHRKRQVEARDASAHASSNPS